MDDINDIVGAGAPNVGSEQSLLDSLAQARTESAESRETFISIPGYEDSGIELLARYRLMEGPELEAIARKIQGSNKNKQRRSAKSSWHLNLAIALDVMIAACTGIFYQRATDEEPLPLTVGGEEVTGYGDPKLAEGLKLADAETARKSVLATFCGNELSVSNHSIKLQRWFQNTNASVDDEFLGEG